MITVENIMQFLTVIDQFVTAYYTFYCLKIYFWETRYFYLTYITNIL